ncbi:hypothetical protein I7I50_08585 [Histoplasma capsulatum G186AR]|uniref:Uncharacterized protein n=1 Tax=Ajellomyces capsulatus TaxID=5037 RepID=A0A8H7YT74_AJECA|nr:hypothetical protein I7I52_06100 [Histoplasma capsulatum]QSS73703.1 hypothetical protein I7I50_08585 [Histoplasma capsulatum G186AR]
MIINNMHAYPEPFPSSKHAIKSKPKKKGGRKKSRCLPSSPNPINSWKYSRSHQHVAISHISDLPGRPHASSPIAKNNNAPQQLLCKHPVSLGLIDKPKSSDLLCKPQSHRPARARAPLRVGKSAARLSLVKFEDEGLMMKLQALFEPGG